MSDRSLTTALSRWENNRNLPDHVYRGLLEVVLGLPVAEDIAVRTSSYEQDFDRAIEALDVLTRWDYPERRNFTSTAGLVESDGVISGYLFARSHLVDDDDHTPPDSIATEHGSVADRIRAIVSTLMIVDFEEGGGKLGPR